LTNAVETSTPVIPKNRKIMPTNAHHHQRSAPSARLLHQRKSTATAGAAVVSHARQ
jgi:hypothetical protein